jgi:5-bromo-4-chloroindolyl phosphate hydrolysis protein
VFECCFGILTNRCIRFFQENLRQAQEEHERLLETVKQENELNVASLTAEHEQQIEVSSGVNRH